MSELKFIVYDVQHGSCSHVITPANQHIIIDLGSKAETSICRYLKENYFRYGGTIDQLVLICSLSPETCLTMEPIFSDAK